MSKELRIKNTPLYTGAASVYPCRKVHLKTLISFNLRPD